MASVINKPTTRQFAGNLIDQETGQVARIMPYTMADLAWWAAESNRNCRDYMVVLPAPKPISGGAPELDYDRLADESAFMDRYERGLV